MKLSLIVAITDGAGGCSSSTDETSADGASVDELRSGAGDASLREGTAEAKAVVALVNDRTLAASDYEDAVGLPSSTAEALIKVRDGVDLKAATTDDEQFETLAEIDALPRTDAAVFWKLLAYAPAHRDKYFAPAAPPASTSTESRSRTVAASRPMPASPPGSRFLPHGARLTWIDTLRS